MGTNLCTKSRIVMHLLADEADHAIFTDSDDGEPVNHMVALRPDLYADMGCPNRIAITVEPGDQLNF